MLWNVSGKAKTGDSETLLRLAQISNRVKDTYKNLLLLCTDGLSQKKHDTLKETFEEPTNPGKEAEVYSLKLTPACFDLHHICAKDLEREAGEAGVAVPSFLYDRLSACVLTCHKHSGKKILIVSWHGPKTDPRRNRPHDRSEEFRRFSYRDLVQLTNQIKQKRGCDVAMAGGDFNLIPTTAKDIMRQDFYQLHAEIADDYKRPDRPRKIDFLVYWPKWALKVTETEVVMDDLRWCNDQEIFNHPIIMYGLSLCSRYDLDHEVGSPEVAVKKWETIKADAKFTFSCPQTSLTTAQAKEILQRLPRSEVFRVKGYAVTRSNLPAEDKPVGKRRKQTQLFLEKQCDPETLVSFDRDVRSLASRQNCTTVYGVFRMRGYVLRATANTHTLRKTGRAENIGTDVDSTPPTPVQNDAHLGRESGTQSDQQHDNIDTATVRDDEASTRSSDGAVVQSHLCDPDNENVDKEFSNASNQMNDHHLLTATDSGQEHTQEASKPPALQQATTTSTTLQQVFTTGNTKQSALQQVSTHGITKQSALQQVSATTDADEASAKQRKPSTGTQQTQNRTSLPTTEPHTRTAIIDLTEEDIGATPLGHQNSPSSVVKATILAGNTKVGTHSLQTSSANNQHLADSSSSHASPAKRQKTVADSVGRTSKQSALQQVSTHGITKQSALQQVSATGNTKQSALQQVSATGNTKQSAFQQVSTHGITKQSALQQVSTAGNTKQSALQQVSSTENTKQSALQQVSSTENTKQSALQQVSTHGITKQSALQQVSATTDADEASAKQRKPSTGTQQTQNRTSLPTAEPHTRTAIIDLTEEDIGATPLGHQNSPSSVVKATILAGNTKVGTHSLQTSSANNQHLADSSSSHASPAKRQKTVADSVGRTSKQSALQQVSATGNTKQSALQQVSTHGNTKQSALHQVSTAGITKQSALQQVSSTGNTKQSALQQVSSTENTKQSALQQVSTTGNTKQSALQKMPTHGNTKQPPSQPVSTVRSTKPTPIQLLCTPGNAEQSASEQVCTARNTKQSAVRQLLISGNTKQPPLQRVSTAMNTQQHSVDRVCAAGNTTEQTSQQMPTAETIKQPVLQKGQRAPGSHYELYVHSAGNTSNSSFHQKPTVATTKQSDSPEATKKEPETHMNAQNIIQGMADHQTKLKSTSKEISGSHVTGVTSGYSFKKLKVNPIWLKPTSPDQSATCGSNQQGSRPDLAGASVNQDQGVESTKHAGVKRTHNKAIPTNQQVVHPVSAVQATSQDRGQQMLNMTPRDRTTTADEASAKQRKPSTGTQQTQNRTSLPTTEPHTRTAIIDLTEEDIGATPLGH
ncbi:hypothetical protein BaRGS_00028254 [Batillaria attramentaria]|uniref:Endonuclease/exonuclease/phosphatase domain-containing protein n=1 Tax=Batillaria attramentaria TaxID=370345 RepID=A0ABD0K0Z2_9CAEN